MPVTSDFEAQFARAISGLTGDKSRKIGLAVSGGGDSIAMMHLAAKYFVPDQLCVFSINHGLRTEAAAEIALVTEQAERLGLDHVVAHWQWDGTGNLQAAARVGRWAALVDLAKIHSVGTIWLGHTEDDQVETAFLRLARGSGVDGLTGMAQSMTRDGMPLMRPLLDIPRLELRTWLQGQGIAWCDDPSNDDTRFDRIRARQMSEQLETLGLTRKRMLQTVRHMQAAKLSLDQAAERLAKMHVRQDRGDLIIDHAACDLSVEDVPRRVMAQALGWVSGQTYRPRFDAMVQAIAKAVAGETITFHGCVLAAEGDDQLRLTREPAATQTLVIDTFARDVTWDGRWHITGPFKPNQTVSALGDDIKDCPNWRDVGLPRRSLMASPAIWQDEILIAAPLAGFGDDWSTQIVADFHSAAFAIED